ncbi:uncharacterized protein LOC134833441 [Culicoides brevitarsis]|uniref:uncharacterized protein LOC134833441 n=1 Tax=Culicoides brevitarsis TaxID=469753 RepID=UPI00307B22E7
MSRVFDPISKVWRRRKVWNTSRVKKSVGEVVYQSLMENLSTVCQISDDSGEIYTNERMLKAAVSFARGLTCKGINVGDKVIVLMHNYHYLLPCWLGCILAGVILCPFHFLNTSIKEELCELIALIEPKAMFTSYLEAIEMFQEIFEQLNIRCPIYVYENKIDGCHDMKPFFEEHVAGFHEFRPKSTVDPDRDLMVIILSSSTTGKPKLINGTHSQLLDLSVGSFSKLTFASTMQPGWHSEFILAFILLIQGCPRVIRAHYTIDDFLLMLERHKVQFIYIKPKDIFQMIKSRTIKTVNLEALKRVASTGEHMSIKMAQDLQKYIPKATILSCYGISDVGGGLTDCSDMKAFVHQLVGKIRRGFEFIVIDDNGKRLGPKTIGELCCRSMTLPFPGYYKNEKLTRQSLTKDGFFATGDLAYLDIDGNVFLIERKKFNIPYRGKLLNQGNVERIILENVEGISAVCVVDVESDQHGVMPYIAIVPDIGVTLKKDEIVQTVMKYHPFTFETKVFFFESLPMTISSKFRKHIIREMIMKKLYKSSE